VLHGWRLVACVEVCVLGARVAVLRAAGAAARWRPTVRGGRSAAAAPRAPRYGRYGLLRHMHSAAAAVPAGSTGTQASSANNGAMFVRTLLLLLSAAAGAAAAAAAASTGGEGAQQALWDVAISRRPYIGEAEGNLLLRTDPSLAAERLSVAALLPCAGGRSWNWTLTPGSATEHILPLGSLDALPPRLNNDMLITFSVNGGGAGTSVRRRFQRAYRASFERTAQIDHSVAGIRVDGNLWAGFGWYVYPWSSFDGPFAGRSNGQRRANVCSDKEALTKNKALHADCVRWGVQNETAAMAAMAERGVTMIMPYALNVYEHDGLPLPVDEGNALILHYLDVAAYHGLKILFPIATIGLDRGHYTNHTLAYVRQTVALVKDHSALLAYYICDDCEPHPDMSVAYNEIFRLDPFHVTVGAAFGGNKIQYLDTAQNPSSGEYSGTAAHDEATILPGINCTTGPQAQCDKNVCPSCVEACTGHSCGTSTHDQPIPKTALSLDVVMIENYSPSADTHAAHDHDTLRKGVEWTPMVNCPGSYTLEESISPHKPPKLLQTIMWMSTIAAGTVNQLIFAGARPTPMINASIGKVGSHPEASAWGTKGSFMLYDQLNLYAAQATVIMQSLYSPFGLPQPRVNVTIIALAIPEPPNRGWPHGHHIVARAWRQEPQNTSWGWCGHLVVASGVEQSGATFTLALGGSFPVNSTWWWSRRAVRLFAADYEVPITADGTMTDIIDAGGHNIYQLVRRPLPHSYTTSVAPCRGRTAGTQNPSAEGF
jgi:hypothetical protein